MFKKSQFFYIHRLVFLIIEYDFVRLRFAFSSVQLIK